MSSRDSMRCGRLTKAEFAGGQLQLISGCRLQAVLLDVQDQPSKHILLPDRRTSPGWRGPAQDGPNTGHSFQQLKRSSGLKR
jgi:hypothetical protein